MALAAYVRKGKEQKAQGQFSRLFVGPANALVEITGRFGAIGVQASGQTLAAKGASQASAPVIANSSVLINASTSAQGVKLPSVTAGPINSVIEAYADIGNIATVKVYPDSGSTIDIGATNAAITVAKQKGVKVRRVSATRWVTVLKGA
jgi:hypothetical protein